MERSVPIFNIGVPDQLPRSVYSAQGALTPSDYPSVMFRIRRVAANSALLQSYINQVRVNVVGRHGPRPTFSDIESEAERMKLEEMWKAYARSPTVDGTGNWSQFLQSLVGSLATDGRVFVAMRMHRDYPSMAAAMPLTREWLVDEYVASEKTYKTQNKKEVRAMRGIVRKPSGMRAGYLFWGEPRPQDVSAQSSAFTYRGAAHTPMFVNNAAACDLMSPRAASDVDGTLGQIAPAVDLVSRIAAIDRAMADSMESSAKKMGFITRDHASEPYGDEDVPPPQEFEAGHIEELPPGYGFAPYDPQAPNGSITDYRRDLVKNASAALGVDHSSFSGDLSDVNYSSLRHGALVSRDVYRTMQDTLEERVCGPILRYLMDAQIAAGILSISDETYKKAAMTSWRHRAWAWVDPAKDAEASRLLMRSGLVSPQSVASSIGSDWSQALAEIAEFKAALKSNGLEWVDLAQVAGTADRGYKFVEEEEEQSASKSQPSNGKAKSVPKKGRLGV